LGKAFGVVVQLLGKTVTREWNCVKLEEILL
jgi:hypothetical protein